MNAANPSMSTDTASEPESNEASPVKEWSFEVSHRHARLGLVVDTYITLWRVDQQSAGTPRWVIEKRLRELGGSTLAALSVAEERRIIQELTRLELPCAPLAEWTGELGGSGDPYALYTVYVGPSLEEAFRYPLSEADFRLLLAAVLEAAARFADARVLPVDFKVDNVGCGLTGGLQGNLDFQKVRLFDNRHTVIGGQSRLRPWPYIGLPEGSPAEVVVLLQEDTRRDLKDQAPGCPVRTLAELRELPVEQQTYWMSQLKSPALGGAIDDGSLDIHKALQCMLANSLLALLRRHEDKGSQILPSRRLHPQAIAFLKSLSPLLQRMTSANPADRYDTLIAAAAAVRNGLAWQPLSSGILRLRRPDSAAVEGASQPFTEPAEEFPFAMDPPGAASVAGTWAHWTSVGQGFSLTNSALRGHRWSAAVMAALLIAPLLTGWVRIDDDPGSMKLIKPQAHLPGSKVPTPIDEATLQSWLKATKAKEPQLRQEAEALLADHCKRLSHGLAVSLSGKPLHSTEIRAATQSELQRLAKLGVGACAGQREG